MTDVIKALGMLQQQFLVSHIEIIKLQKMVLTIATIHRTLVVQDHVLLNIKCLTLVCLLTTKLQD